MKRKHAVTAVVLLALLSGVGWALFSDEDHVVVEIKQKRDELFQKIDTMSDEQRRAEFDALREQTRELSEEQRHEVWKGGRKFMMQRVDKLLAMTKDEQNKELDKWIDRMEERRNNREARGDQDRKGPPGGGGRGRSGKGRLDNSSPEMRGKMDAMKDLINDRRKARGLEPIRGGRGMFGGRGGPR